MNSQSWLEISRENLKHNLSIIRQASPNTIMAPCVKANAYGHGLVAIGKIFLDSGANWLCVTSLDEAEKLRRAGITCPILIIGVVFNDELEKIIDLDLRFFLHDTNTAINLSEVGQRRNKTVSVHIKIDTGMHRHGVLTENLEDFMKHVVNLPNINIEGVATHFATSDEPLNPSYFESQLKSFREALEKINRIVKKKLIVHCDKSASVLVHRNDFVDLVRPGIAAYGYYPGKDVKKICEDMGIFLQPALTFKTKLSNIKTLPADSYVGYGCSYRTARMTKIATIPVGYFDGYDRKLSNRGQVLVNGKRTPILGRVCMNVTIIDVTDCGNVKNGDEVVLIGRQGAEKISVEDVADWANTINYEIITRLRESVVRYYV